MKIVQTLVSSQIKSGILDIHKEAQPWFPFSIDSIRIPIFFDEQDFPTYVNLACWKFNTPMLTGLSKWYARNSAKVGDEVVIEILESAYHLRFQKSGKSLPSEPFWESVDLKDFIEKLPNVERAKALYSLDILKYSYGLAQLIMKTEKVWVAFCEYYQLTTKLQSGEETVFRPFSAIGSAMDDLWKIKRDSGNLRLPIDQKSMTIHKKWLETIDCGLDYFNYLHEYLIDNDTAKRNLGESCKISFIEGLKTYEKHCSELLDEFTNILRRIRN